MIFTAKTPYICPFTGKKVEGTKNISKDFKIKDVGKAHVRLPAKAKELLR